MARVLVWLCVFAGTVEAAPRYTRKPIVSTSAPIVAAERLWTAAANEPDVAKATAAWERAAEAFIAIAESSATKPERAEAAHAAVLAWQNVAPRVDAARPVDEPYDAIPVPRPIPPHDRKLMHAIDVYHRFDSTSDDAIGAGFQRANILRRHDHFDEAIAALLEHIEKHHGHETAGYAAMLVLDSFNRLQKYDELVKFAIKVRADRTFLANKADLEHVVDRIYVQSLRKAAEHLERAARDTKDQAGYHRCGDAYIAIHETPNNQDADGELLYNALVCFQSAGSMAAALRAATMLTQLHPKSRLVPRALGRVAKITSQIGNFSEAAQTAEVLLQRYPRERDARAVAEDAVAWRLGTGNVAAAARTFDQFLRTTRRDHTATALAVLEAMLAAGMRREAAAFAATAKLDPIDPIDPTPVLRAARALAGAACPVALVDELCSKPRDAALIGKARALLDRIPASNATAGEATRMQLDLDLERVLEAKRPDASAVAAGYHELAKSRDASVRIAARARLARISRRLGNADDARAQLAACVEEARSATSEWLFVCERAQAAMKIPVDQPRERLPRVAIPPIGVATDSL